MFQEGKGEERWVAGRAAEDWGLVVKGDGWDQGSARLSKKSRSQQLLTSLAWS